MEPSTNITDHFTANEAMQLLIIHFKHPEYDISITKEEVKHLELSVIDDWENLSRSYLNQLVSKDKLKTLSAMSNNGTYLL
mgnify:CR=1 FL=1